VGGAITGLRGATGVVLANAGEVLSVAADGSFAFASRWPSGTTYDVTVTTQPTEPWQSCTVGTGSGAIGAANVDSVQVACSTRTYAVGGWVVGLAGATGLVLRNNGGDDLPIGSAGAFTFATSVPSGAPYLVTVAQQPVGATCTPSQASGTLAGEAVSSVTVSCSALAFQVGGTVSGLVAQDAASPGLTLSSNSGDRLAIHADGRFTFPTPMAYGTPYGVSLRSQPTSPPQTCVVEAATAFGPSITADVTNVEVRCLPPSTPGNLDTDFGTHGVTLIDFEARLGADTLPAAVLVPEDGSIIVAGTTDQAASKDFALVRVGADGVRDRGFNGGANDGFVRTGFTHTGSNRLDYARAIARQSDGRIVVAGYTSSWDFAVARYLPDGALDTGFGTGGLAVVGIGVIDYALAVAVDPAGRIVVAGTATGNGEDFALARFTADGRPDASFNGGDAANTSGAIRTHISRDDRAQALAIQPDGKIVAAGYSNGRSADFAAVRYLEDGSLDPTFGAAGTGVATVEMGSVDRAAAMLLLPGGRILLGGYSGAAFSADFVLVQLTAGGLLDAGFGTGGIVRTDIAGSYDYLKALAVDAGGRIVAVGSSHNGLNNDIAIARYSSAGVPDASFGSGGVLVSPVGGGNEEATAVLVQPDGKIVVVGQADNGTNGNNVNVDFVLLRVLP